MGQLIHVDGRYLDTVDVKMVRCVGKWIDMLINWWIYRWVDI